MIEDSDLQTQRKIRDLIRRNPGLYPSKIAKLLNMEILLVESYLKNMEKNKIITGLQGTNCRQYYIEHPSDTAEYGVKTWEKIHFLISENPGLHLSKIAKTLKMSKPLAEYHLLQMEKNDKITVIKESGFKRYYIKGSEIGVKDKKNLSLLRKEIPLKIVLFLADHPNAKHKEILKHLHVTPSTLSYHLNILIRHEIVSVQRYGTEKGYNLKNKKELIHFVIKYRLHNIVVGYKDFWNELNYERW